MGDVGGWIVVPLTTIIVFTKTLMMAECCEECCEQMEEDAYSEWLRGMGWYMPTNRSMPA